MDIFLLNLYDVIFSLILIFWIIIEERPNWWPSSQGGWSENESEGNRKLAGQLFHLATCNGHLPSRRRQTNQTNWHPATQYVYVNSSGIGILRLVQNLRSSTAGKSSRSGNRTRGEVLHNWRYLMARCGGNWEESPCKQICRWLEKY